MGLFKKKVSYETIYNVAAEKAKSQLNYGDMMNEHQILQYIYDYFEHGSLDFHEVFDVVQNMKMKGLLRRIL